MKKVHPIRAIKRNKLSIFTGLATFAFGALICWCYYGIVYKFNTHPTHFMWMFRHWFDNPVTILNCIFAFIVFIDAAILIAVPLTRRHWKCWIAAFIPCIFIFICVKKELRWSHIHYNDKFIKEYGNTIYDTYGNFVAGGNDYYHAIVDFGKEHIELQKIISNDSGKYDTITGFCNLQGKVLTPCKYKLRYMSHNLYKAYNPKTGKHGILSGDTWTMVIPCEYYMIDDFDEYIRLYSDYNHSQLIDFEGNLLLPEMYTYNSHVVNDQFNVRKECGYTGIYSTTEKREIIPCDRKQSISYQTGGWYLVERADETWAAYTQSGKLICTAGDEFFRPIQGSCGQIWCKTKSSTSTYNYYLGWQTDYYTVYKKYSYDGDYLGEERTED